jgi:hypothetical protein
LADQRSIFLFRGGISRGDGGAIDVHDNIAPRQTEE